MLPPSVANVAIGFDILGFSVDALGDRVTLTPHDEPGAHPARSPNRRRAAGRRGAEHRRSRAAGDDRSDAASTFGFEMEIDKGIPLASGPGRFRRVGRRRRGGRQRAARRALTRIELLQMAMEGEAVASGSRHPDNISPSLYGGMVLTVGIDHPRVKQIPVPKASTR